MIRAVSTSSTSFSGGGFVRKVRLFYQELRLQGTVMIVWRDNCLLSCLRLSSARSQHPFSFITHSNLKDLLTRRWYRVGDKIAREKAGQALRDAIKTRRATVKKRSHSHDGNYTCSSEPKPLGHGHTYESASSSSGDEGPSTLRIATKIRASDQSQRHDCIPTEIYSSKDVPGTSMKRPQSAMDGSPLDPPSSVKPSTCISSNLKTIFNPRQDNAMPAPLIASNTLFESQLSSELEPRPISSVVEPLCDSRTLPNFRSFGQQQVTVNMRQWSPEECHHSPTLGKTSMSIEDQKPRLLVQQIRSEESAVELLRYLLQPDETCEGNDMLSYSHFFVSTNWRSSHLDEFGFCCVAESDRLEHSHSQESNRDFITASMDTGFDFHSDVRAPTSSAPSLLLDHGVDKSNDASQQDFQRSCQNVLPTVFACDQFSKMGRGSGRSDSGRKYQTSYYPDLIQSNNDPPIW